MARVSLIVTVYNKAPYLKRCFDSIVNQIDKSAEVIIIDDGSTDGSTKICAKYASKYKWLLCCTQNRGVSEARNLGLDRATGDYIAFVDADDALTPDAIDIMTRIARHEFNIYQFGHIRRASGKVTTTHRALAKKGFYGLDKMPKHWQIVWNKLYKADFIKKHKIRFISGMQFGEDEMFNARAILANNGLYQAPQVLMEHYFDDFDSLCRGQLDLERLQRLLDELKKLGNRQKDKRKKQWCYDAIERHSHSRVFLEYGYQRKNSGKYDIVYFLKRSPINEELRYSLRSVEQNWQYKSVWFYGGCPEGIRPDHHVDVAQLELTKWERVRGMLRKACLNDDITDDFWLFNDDFFVLTPHNENMPPQYNTTLQERISSIESRHGGNSTEYTERLRHLVKTLKKAKKGYLDYTVHKPMLINRKKMLEVLDKFPDEPMSRALYGNYWKIGGESNHDMKIQRINYNKAATAIKEWDFVSTSDESFRNGNIGRYLRDKFDIKSRFEV